jgi:phosphonate transport system ATP-binding protein
MLQITNLQKKLPDGRLLLKDISLQVREGEFVGILGLSGVGKTILIRCLNRLTTPDGGEVRLERDGHQVGPFNLTSCSEKELKTARRSIAMVFQNYNLVGRLSVLENVLIGKLGYMSLWDSLMSRFSDEDKEQAMGALEIVGLTALAKRRVETLSGGEKQRVAIARAVMQKPWVLLADEPVANLDPKTSREVMAYLKLITEEQHLCTLAVLHQPDLVQEYCTRAVGIKTGTVIYDGMARLSNDALTAIYN